MGTRAAFWIGDPVNLGGREWLGWTGGCNGCMGKGVRTSWPTKWETHEGDIMALEDVPNELSAYTVIANDKAYHTRSWNGKEYEPGELGEQTVKEFLAELGITDGYLVTVDYHC